MKRIASQPNRMKLELGLIATVLLVINLPLLFGRVCDPLIFFPAQAAAGEWWRTVTFPLVHVSLYHLLLDASAFLLLYHGLHETPLPRRWGLVGCCTAGSLLMAMAASPLDGGLCGLSGVAHGLMAISGLELTRSSEPSLRKAGWICLAIIILKSLFELLTGRVLFAGLHLGSVGTPVAATHFGGVLGGIVGFALLISRAQVDTASRRGFTDQSCGCCATKQNASAVLIEVCHD